MVESATGRGELWSYIAGERGVSRVRVYERRPGSPLWVEWHDKAGLHQKTLSTAAGSPIRDRKLARQLADKMALSQRVKRERQILHTLLGIRPERTFRELVEIYHERRSSEWSSGRRRAQECARRFWLCALGERALLSEITADRARHEVQAEARRRQGIQWSGKTQARHYHYLTKLMRYAAVQLRWISNDEMLSGLNVSKPKGKLPSYSKEEITRILQAAPDIDPRMGGICWIAALTGRRSGAIRTLRVDAYTRSLIDDAEYGVLQFPAKARNAQRAGDALLPPSACAVLNELITRPRVQSSGLMFPSGDLYRRGPALPVSEDWVIDTMRRVERAAEVAQRKWRPVHALKQRGAMEGEPLDLHAAERSAGTAFDVLSGTDLRGKDSLSGVS
jgi:hypothetical protein